MIQILIEYETVRCTCDIYWSQHIRRQASQVSLGTVKNKASAFRQEALKFTNTKQKRNEKNSTIIVVQLANRTTCESVVPFQVCRNKERASERKK